MTPDVLSSNAVRRLLIQSLVMPPALLGILAVVFVGQIVYLMSTARWVERTDQVISRANKLLRVLVDGETGMRGYLITGDPLFLEPYYDQENQAGPSFAELIELVSDDPTQVDRLRVLRAVQSDWQTFSRTLIGVRREGGDYQTVVRTGEGKRRMDSMRQQVGDFIRTEEELREARTRAVRHATLSIGGASLTLAMLLGSVLALSSRRRLRRVMSIYQNAIDKVEGQAASLGKNAHRLETLHDIDRAILAAESAPEVVCSALHRMTRFVPRDVAFVVVFGSDQGPPQLIYRTDETGRSEIYDGRLGRVDLSIPSERDKLHAVPDLAEVVGRNGLEECLFQCGYRSSMIVPLRVGERVLGMLVLADSKPSAFTDEQHQIADEVARQLAIGLEQAGLRERLKSHADHLEERVKERTRELQEALDSVKQLQGLLPICAWCKKVRDDQNYWQDVEHYVVAHTKARFSHGICPACYKSNLDAAE